MKQKNIITVTLLSLLVGVSGCTSSTNVSPQENKELNNVSSTTTNKKPGLMQTTLDGWLKDDWTPTVEKDPEIKKKYMKKRVVKKGENNTTEEIVEYKYTETEDRNFTLQEYVDKAVAYQKAHPNDYNNSNVKKLESMPVIGK
jgi:hypothetical protein